MASIFICHSHVGTEVTCVISETYIHCSNHDRVVVVIVFCSCKKRGRLIRVFIAVYFQYSIIKDSGD